MNWRYVSKSDGNGTAVQTFNYSCRENSALRSCARENNTLMRGGQAVSYGCPVARRTAAAAAFTVDVEDLGRCFVENNYNMYPSSATVQKFHGKLRGVYRGTVQNGGNFNSDDYQRDVNLDPAGAKSPVDVVDSFGKDNRVSPSERTWVNIKEAFLNGDENFERRNNNKNNDDDDDDDASRKDYKPLESGDGGFFILSNDSNEMATRNPRRIDTGYLNDSSSATWTTGDDRDGGEFYRAGNAAGANYFDRDVAAWFETDRGNPNLNIPNDEATYHHHHHRRRRRPSANQFDARNRERIETPGCFKEFDYCTEEQWLRCPAAQCPTLQENYRLHANQFEPSVVPPCMERSSKLHFYYGEDIGYLTPAEYQRYEQDFLSNEKRKEKSRDAARCRRTRETNIFTELGKELPIPEDQAEHLDKASVMRLAIAYLKVRTVIDAIPEPLAKPEPSPDTDGLFLKALDGFMMVLSSDGDMVYLSENVSEYLGVSQMDMMGQNVYDYSHPCDHDELRECLSTKPSSLNEEKQSCNLFLRLKCTLTSKGRKVNLKSASYKVIHCIGHMVVTPRDLSAPMPQNEENEDSSEANEDIEVDEKQDKGGTGGCLILVGCPVPHPSNIEAPLGRYTFLSKHSLNMKFTYADEKLAEYLGWDNNELIGQSVFEFHHASDNPQLDKSFKSLFSKGQCETTAYRFLGKKGGYAWVVTQATLIHCAKQHKPLSVVCVNYILSGIECENEVYSARQLEARSVDDASVDVNQPASPVAPVSLLATVAVLKNGGKKEEESNFSEDIKNGKLLICQNNNNNVGVVQERQRPQSVTASLFRTHDKLHREIFDSKKIIDQTKEDTSFPKPVSRTDQILGRKDFVEESESRKENQPLEQRNNPLSAVNQNDRLIFQGKPVKYFTGETQRVRPQVVTRSLFAPAPPPHPQEPPSRPPPQTSTASIFAPRTKDMNKGFLTFSEDQPGLTMLKDEPEDLTHLAPTPGDVCVPLEDTPFLSDMLDDFILGTDNYCPLLSPGLPTELRASELGDSLKESDLEESLRNSELGESLADSDPFMYRDSPSSCSGSPNLLSPALSKSPGSIDSLCSPSGSGGGLSEDEMLMLSINDVLADEELALRAPYIPMSDQDETLQLFITDDMVMWPQPPDKKPKWSNVTENSESNVGSSLEQLLRTNSSGNVRKCNDHGGGLVDPTDALGNIYKKNTKEEDTAIWQSKSERSQKRVHCTTSPVIDNNNKRLKCSSEERDVGNNLDLINNKVAGGRNVNLNLNLNLSPRHGGSQLLQQLMSQQSPVKNRGDHSAGGNEGGGGGGGGADNCGSNGSTNRQQHPQQQSNSVLMNLLVSGCDEIIDPRNIPPLLQRKISPLSVNLDNHIVPQIPPHVTLEHLSPDTRNELVNSLPRVNNKLTSPQELEPMDFENFAFDVSPLSFELLQGTDLLKIPANNLV